MTNEAKIQELIQVAAQGIRGLGDKTADFVRGSDYEALVGPSAMIWWRQELRTTDLFNAVNFNTAEGEDLTELARKRYKKERILDSHGTGRVKVIRPAGGIAETIWKGTRILVPGSNAKVYRTTEDKAIAASTLDAVIPIEAVEIGPGYAVSAGPDVARFDDALKDPTWRIQSLDCSDGTLFEKAEVFRERIRRERFEARVGQSKRIVEVCREQGASSVAVFRSDFAGDNYDYGLNFVYVGDLSNTGTPELLKACSLALDSVRVLGDHLQVRPIVQAAIDVNATIKLNASPALFDLTRLERVHSASITQYLNGQSGSFTFSLDGIKSAIARHTPEVNRISLSTPTSDGLILEGTLKNFPASLNRYVPGKITLRYESI